MYIYDILLLSRYLFSIQRSLPHLPLLQSLSNDIFTNIKKQRRDWIYDISALTVDKVVAIVKLKVINVPQL
jgi:hypothetical protein